MRLLTFMTFVTFDKSSFIHVSNRNTRVRELLQSYSISSYLHFIRITSLFEREILPIIDLSILQAQSANHQ